MIEFSLLAIACFLAAKQADNVFGEIVFALFGLGFLVLAGLSAPYERVF